MPSFHAHVMNFIFRCMPQDKPGQPHDYAAERKRNDRQPPKPPRGVTVEIGQLGGMNAEYIRKPGNRDLIFYIHGGGFCVGSAKERRDICQLIAAQYGYNCVSFDYRLAPENPWPAQLEDCLKAYQAILEQGYAPEEIVLMGESAGGTLVLSLPLKLKELGLPQPKAIISFSPCVTHAEHFPSHTANIKTDYMLRDGVAKGMGEPVFGKNATDMKFLRDPCVSPLYGDYSGLPPVFLSASDTEALLDDAVMLHRKLQEAGHPTQLDIQHGLPHAFQVFSFMPECRKTMQKVFAFLVSCK